ncbi:MAG: hypothetical protein WCP09_02560 [Candidatus Taylorbacteria bacterium]
MSKRTVLRAVSISLAIFFISLSLSALVRAETTTSTGICPKRFICVKTKASCPIGYVCTPNDENSYGTIKMQAMTSNTNYVPGTWYNNAILINDRTMNSSMSTNAVRATNLVGTTSSTASVSGQETDANSSSNSASASSNPEVYSGLVTRDDSVWQHATNLSWTAYTTDQPGALITLCRFPITDDGARLWQQVLRERGINADFLTDDSTLYVTWTASSYRTYLAQSKTQSAGKASQQFPASRLARCLDSDYVSNFPEWSSHFTSVLTPKAAPLPPLATSSVSYNVSVNYSSFAAEAQQNHYTSIYTGSGTKIVSVTVFKFNDSPTMTADQVISNLNSLGYRPAVISELAALRTGLGIVALGTNLGGSYGYPVTGTGSNGSFNQVTGLG